MLEIIQYEDIKKYKRYISFDLNTRSKLYFDKDIIHKIPNSLKSNFEEILKYIDDLNLDALIELRNLIYEDNQLVGYSFKNYKEYNSLRRLKNRDFKLKIEDCYKIIYEYDLLSRYNLKYSDFHLGNILVNEETNSIKICDIDGISLTQDKKILEAQFKWSIIISLSYLYNVNYYDIRNIINARGVDNINNQINKFCKNINFLTIQDTINLISQLDFNLIQTERKEIISKSKELCETGYYTYRRY